MRATQYLLRDEGFGAEVVAGPIPAHDDDQFEDTLISFLKDHPWDDGILYQCLMIDEKGIPTIETFMDEYLEPLLAEAWGFILPEHEDDEDSEEENAAFKELRKDTPLDAHDEEYPNGWD